MSCGPRSINAARGRGRGGDRRECVGATLKPRDCGYGGAQIIDDESDPAAKTGSEAASDIRGCNDRRTVTYLDAFAATRAVTRT